MSHGNRTGRLDTELSDRLGIGKSHTPLSDSLNKYANDAAGDYASNGIGVKEPWDNERGIGVMGHERLHSFQNSSNAYDPEVWTAVKQLREDLTPYLHDNDQIAKSHRNGSRDINYWTSQDEQEARMFEDYLKRNQYIQRGGWDEYGAEIDPAFNKFLNTLRDLSGRGIALPVGLLAGGSALGALMGRNDDGQGSLTF